jgi:hypothetical protein
MGPAFILSHHPGKNIPGGGSALGSSIKSSPGENKTEAFLSAPLKSLENRGFRGLRSPADRDTLIASPKRRQPITEP